jgi:hypothetical protein
VAAGGFDDVRGRLSGFPEDLDFWSRLAAVGRLKLIEHDIALYRIHSESISSVHGETLVHGARFIQACASARKAGTAAPDWNEFMRVRPPLTDLELARIAYRQAAAAALNGHPLRAALLSLESARRDPRFVLRRAVAQLRP